MKASFALNLSPEGIGLLHRTAGGWELLSHLALDGPDLPEAITALRARAEALGGGAAMTKLIIPPSQVLYTEMAAPGPTVAERRQQIAAGLEGLTPYAVPDLAYDWSGHGDTVRVAVVARTTLREAEAFAEFWGFVPVSFVAVPDPTAFAGEPWFGTAHGVLDRLNGSERIVRDQDPVPLRAAYAAGPVWAPEAETAEPPAETPIVAEEPPVPAPDLTAEAPLPPEDQPLIEPAPDLPEADEAIVADTDEPEDVAQAPDEGAADPEIRPDVPEIVPEDIDTPDTDLQPTTLDASEQAPVEDRTTEDRATEICATDTTPGPAEPPPDSGFHYNPGTDDLAPVFQHEPQFRHNTDDQAAEAEPEEDAPAPLVALTQPDAPSKAISRDALTTATQGHGPRNRALRAERTVPPKRGAGVMFRHDYNATPIPEIARAAQDGLSRRDRQRHVESERRIARRSIAEADAKSRWVLLLTTGFVVFVTAAAVVAAFGGTQDKDPAAMGLTREHPVPLTAPDRTGWVLPAEYLPSMAVAGATPVRENGVRLAALGNDTSRDGTLPVRVRSDISPADPHVASILPQDALAPGMRPVAEPAAPLIRLAQNSAPDTAPRPRVRPDAVARSAAAASQGDATAAKPAARPATMPTTMAATPTPILIETGQTPAPPGLRPAPRPNDLAADVPAASAAPSRPDASAFADATPQAVSVSRQPKSRPTTFKAAVDKALAAAIASEMPPEPPVRTAAVQPPPAQPQVQPPTQPRPAAQQPPPQQQARAAPQPAAPQPQTPEAEVELDEPEPTQPLRSIPTSASVAKQATHANALKMREMTLIGLYGASQSRRALVRMPNGKMIKVSVGDRLDGGRVTAIGEGQMSYQKGTRAYTLRMLQGS